MHKVFLKSGCARVVLTIRPGFEEDFLTFMDSCDLLPNKTRPYRPIVKEMQDLAKTNYPGIPTANPGSNLRRLVLRKQQKAWKEMQDIMKLLEKYRETDTEKRYPEPAKVYPITPGDASVLESFTEGKPDGVTGCI